MKTANNAKYGTILVDSKGNTLYTLVNKFGVPVPCEAGCPDVWPPLLAPTGTKNLTGGTGVTGLQGGHAEVQYQGYPLFRYSGDTAPGQANGNGISSYGGTWYVIKPSVHPGTPITSSG